MAKKDFSMAFAKFANNEIKDATLSDGTEIRYRELTMREQDSFTSRLIKDSNGVTGGDTTPNINYDAFNEIKYEKAAAILVEPSVTADELREFRGFGAMLNEINALADKSDGEGLDEEGN